MNMKHDERHPREHGIKSPGKNKRFVRYSDGADMYSMCLSKFQQLARDAGACYKVGQLVLVNLEHRI